MSDLPKVVPRGAGTKLKELSQARRAKERERVRLGAAINHVDCAIQDLERFVDLNGVELARTHLLRLRAILVEELQTKLK